MEQQQTNKKPLLYALIVVVAVAVIFALYYYMLKPQMDERAELEEKVAVQRTESQALKTQYNELKADEAKQSDDQGPYKKQVPEGASMDTLVDDLQAAESASSTQITDFTFNAYAAQSIVAEQAKVTTALTEAEEKSGYAADGTPVSDIPESTLPKNAKMITVQLAVSGYSEADIRNFVDQVEKGQRLYIVEKVKYEAPDAEDATSDDIVAAKLQITTFYYDAPVVDAKDATVKDEKATDEQTTKEDTTTDNK